MKRLCNIRAFHDLYSLLTYYITYQTPTVCIIQFRSYGSRNMNDPFSDNSNVDFLELICTPIIHFRKIGGVLSNSADMQIQGPSIASAHKAIYADEGQREKRPCVHTRILICSVHVGQIDSQMCFICYQSRHLFKCFKHHIHPCGVMSPHITVRS